ncbi:ABC transporter ATP-binding protein [Aureibacter tunicatorum]|uniref:ABC transport system ATP-binding protein n=1 Tax=Aureibacter tunicatorum TaxID=866807 RepID=A0AAE3XL42_9BACT|nr:ABC transporter ATP-binding protein [Aureibacter tunicatorum]MDR6238432.1 putative ABC transport system ATP-binding protein [Aureibacter tunicatorum]BDD03464.1 ABC transporter ATP-binding protein [Aureibacter tunicatorum]
MAIIEIKNLNKTYEGAVPVKAVDNLSLSIEKGEFTAIVGPSGCGKTTLLNLLGGLDEVTSGQILIEGQDMTALSASELTSFRLKNIGFVFQSYNLIPVLTAGENVGFVMELQGVNKPTRDKRAHELLDKFGIGDKFNIRPAMLSGGQQQRVAVARALASRPAFILADEPTANLDSKSTEELLDLMAKMNEEEHVTVVFATHDQRVIDRAKRVVTITDGKVFKDEQVSQLNEVAD